MRALRNNQAFKLRVPKSKKKFSKGPTRGERDLYKVAIKLLHAKHPMCFLKPNRGFMWHGVYI